MAGDAGRLSQCRRCDRRGPRHWLRHGGQGAGLGQSATGALGLCDPSQYGRRDLCRAGVRGDADRPDAGTVRSGPLPRLPWPDHSGQWRHTNHDRGDPGQAGNPAARGQRYHPRRLPQFGADDRSAMWRLGRAVGCHGESGTRPGRRPAGRRGRHRDPVGNARDLWRRKPSVVPRRVPGRRAETAGPPGLVGNLHADERGRDGQQPVAGKQGGWSDDDPGKIPGRGCQGRQRAAGRRGRIRADGDRAGPDFHGYAGLRSGVGHRADRWRGTSDRLHDGARIGLRLKAGPDAETGHERQAVPFDARRYGHQLWRYPDRR